MTPSNSMRAGTVRPRSREARVRGWMDGCMTIKRKRKEKKTSQRTLEPPYNYDRKSNTESVKDYEAHRGECGVSAEWHTLESLNGEKRSKFPHTDSVEENQGVLHGNSSNLSVYTLECVCLCVVYLCVCYCAERTEWGLAGGGENTCLLTWSAMVINKVFCLLEQVL